MGSTQVTAYPFVENVHDVNAELVAIPYDVLFESLFVLKKFNIAITLVTRDFVNSNMDRN